MSEQMQAEIASLNAEIDQAGDPRSGMARVQARIKALEQDGREVPTDLIQIERHLKAECICQSRGG